tara:strand:- start:600 stop:989 length:390 start_codon:yes stop_codon:yes gene_type:complete
MINKFIGIGYLTSDPKSQAFSSKTKCSFTVAINSTQTEVLFIDIETWDKVGSNCEKFLSKGSCVYVEGKLKVNKWEGKDGLKKQRYFVSADIVRFLPNSKKDNDNNNNIENSKPSVTISNIVNEEDMPF